MSDFMVKPRFAFYKLAAREQVLRGKKKVGTEKQSSFLSFFPDTRETCSQVNKLDIHRLENPESHFILLQSRTRALESVKAVYGLSFCGKQSNGSKNLANEERTIVRALVSHIRGTVSSPP